ncbi:MAG: hypothetical protein GX070_09150 [Alcaligenaceae bacterium]|nr:hypothetical protein [Alcaligenaceae bacterium]
MDGLSRLRGNRNFFIYGLCESLDAFWCLLWRRRGDFKEGFSGWKAGAGFKNVAETKKGLSALSANLQAFKKPAN